MDRVDIGTLRAGIGIFIGMARRGLGSLSEKLKGYGIGSVQSNLLNTIWGI